MSEINLTEQQRAAILSRGGSVLVSAGAGSGKTFVLVQRLLAYLLDTEQPRNIDDFLVITYTRAAAAQLRGRIAKELTERLSMDPGNPHLQRQLHRLHIAKIGTAHSYCSSLLREYASRLGLDPSFRIMDEEEGSLMRSKLIDRLLDERYEQAEPDFLLLVDTIGDGRDDLKLQQAVLSLYSKLQSLQDPQKWILEQSRALFVKEDADLARTGWGRSLLESLGSFASSVLRQIDAALDKISSAADVRLKYEPAFTEDRQNFSKLLTALDDRAGWEEVRSLSSFTFTPFKPVRNPTDPELKAQVAEARKTYREAWKKKREVFDPPGLELISDINTAARALKELLSLTRELTRRCEDEKRSRNLMDYSDLEHCTLALLSGPDGEPSQTAQEVCARFTEVLVDEYQDTNEIQDSIFRLLSSNGERLFMVGDIKQSIYRFRLAEPEIFLEKYDSYPDYTQAPELGSRRVNLNANFRSDPAVLSFVNRIFYALMSRRLGGVDYTQEVALYTPRTEESKAPVAEVSILDTKDLCDEAGAPIPHAQAEALYAAKRIHEILQSGRTVIENNLERPVRPGDIAILLRSDKPGAALYAQALAHYGVASGTSADADVLSSAEASTLLCLLRIIDNPRQDIPLLAVMHSPLYNFSAEELAQIRLRELEGGVFDALRISADSSEKCRAFMSDLEEFRELSRMLPCNELIWRIFCDTDIREIYGAMESGERRRANLDAIYAYSSRCAQQNKTDLFSFLTAVDSAARNGAQLSVHTQDANRDAVQIMSIHRSKGLEFPIVFLCDTGRKFNRKDTETSLLSHKRLGVAARYVDMQRMLSFDTAPRVAICEAILSEQLSEEMRVMYVALTRAKHYIYVTLSGSRVQTMLKRASGALLNDPEILKGSGCMAEWILHALLSRMSTEEKNTLQLCGEYSAHEYTLRYLSGDSLMPDKLTKQSSRPPATERTCEPGYEYPQIQNALSWSYAYAAACDIPSKLTATQLKGRFGDEEAAHSAHLPVSRAHMDRPAFITKRTGLTAAQKGTAMHLVMQLINYAACVSLEGVQGEISRLEAMEQLTREQAQSINADKILRFFRTDIGTMLIDGLFTLREFKFSILSPARDYFHGAPDEDEILLQGVVDVCIESGGELLVLDFKTDHIRPGAERARAEHYAGQLRAYALALKRITGKTVSRMLLYFFQTETFAEVSPQEKMDLT